MAENDNKWAQHLDKIAYGVAGFVGLVVLVLPAFLGQDISAKSDEAVRARQALQAKMDSQVNPQVKKIGTMETIAEQWDPGRPHPKSPRWAQQIAPVLVRKIEAGQTESAGHKPPEIIEATCLRDNATRRVGVLVRGAVNRTNENVIVTALELWRKEGEDGLFQKIHSRAPQPSGEFEHVDYSAKPGMIYTYRLATVAKRDPEAPQHITDPEQPRVHSAEAGPTPQVPFDLSVRIYSIVQSQDVEVPTVNCRVKYWNYETDTVEGDLKSIRQYREKERFGGHFLIFLIDSLDRKVTVRNSATGDKYEFAWGEKERPVACWPEPITPAAPEDGEESEDEEPEEPASRKGAGSATKTTPPPAGTPPSGGQRGRRPRF